MHKDSECLNSRYKKPFAQRKIEIFFKFDWLSRDQESRIPSDREWAKSEEMV